MQNLGISDSTPRTESRLRGFVTSLFWIDIKDEVEVDHVTTKGFWVCMAVAIMTLVVTSLQGDPLGAIVTAVFFALGGIGVRQRSRFAAVGVFTVYLLSFIATVRHTGFGFGVVTFVFLAILLGNVRGVWVAARWKGTAPPDAQPPQIEDWRDHFTDTWPPRIWPKARYVFYVLTLLFVASLSFVVVAPTEWVAESLK